MNYHPRADRSTTVTPVRSACVAGVLALLLAGAMAALPPATAAEGSGGTEASGPETSQRAFETPKAAAQALVQALGAADEAALVEIFGAKYQHEVLGDDRAAAKVAYHKAYEAAQAVLDLREEGPDRVVMVIGEEVWPVPIPIVRTDRGWVFDTAEGVEEIVNRRIGANELAAIELLRAYGEAQGLYAAVDRDGDQVLEYAQKILSSPGKHDGLYWRVEEGSGENLSPFGPFIEGVAEYLAGKETTDPYRGYYFKILTRQGEHPPGGRYDYVINGNMIAGYAIVAFPADYGASGITTFVVNQQGQVFQKDLGDNTTAVAGSMEVYNPDETWKEVAD